MLRNAVASAVVAVVMSGFVLAYRATVPESAEPSVMAQDVEQDRQTADVPQQEEQERRERMSDDGAVARQGPRQPLQQRAPMQTPPMQAQAGAMGGGTQGSGGMAMGGMMGMCPMMGGMGGQMNQSGGATQGTDNQAALRQELRQLRQEVRQLKNQQ